MKGRGGKKQSRAKILSALLPPPPSLSPQAHFSDCLLRGLFVLSSSGNIVLADSFFGRAGLIVLMYRETMVVVDLG